MPTHTPDQPARISVAIILCSRQRPILLTRALESLSKLAMPAHCDIRFGVVENDATPIYAPVLERFQKSLNIEHIVEPTPGLCHARNRALETAEKMGVDWLGSVDDDMVINAEWLVHMVKAIRAYPDTNMFVGQWRRIEPENTPAWYPETGQPNTKPTGALIKSASGGNTIFGANVFAQKGMALRYDTQFVSIPGEDTDFGIQYRNRGGKMRHVLEAVTTEEIHPERHSIKDRIIRTEWSQYSLTLIRKKHKNALQALFWNLQIIYRGTVLGLLNIALGVALWPIDSNWGKNRIAFGRIQLAHPRGVIRYFFGKSEGLYQTKTGK